MSRPISPTVSKAASRQQRTKNKRRSATGSSRSSKSAKGRRRQELKIKKPY
jgi:hypothetical protein